MPITFGSHALAPTIAEFLQHYPEVSIDLSLTNLTVDLMMKEGFDVTFRTGELPDSGLMVRRLGPHQLLLYASVERGHTSTR